MDPATLEAQLQQICTLSNPQEKLTQYKTVLRDLLQSSPESSRVALCKPYLDSSMAADLCP